MTPEMDVVDDQADASQAESPTLTPKQYAIRPKFSPSKLSALLLSIIPLFLLFDCSDTELTIGTLNENFRELESPSECPQSLNSVAI